VQSIRAHRPAPALPRRARRLPPGLIAVENQGRALSVQFIGSENGMTTTGSCSTFSATTLTNGGRVLCAGRAGSELWVRSEIESKTWSAAGRICLAWTGRPDENGLRQRILCRYWEKSSGCRIPGRQ